MKITVLVNNTAPQGFGAEWGLSFYIVHGDKKYLLDTGASGLFVPLNVKRGLIAPIFTLFPLRNLLVYYITWVFRQTEAPFRMVPEWRFSVPITGRVLRQNAAALPHREGAAPQWPRPAAYP